MPKKTNYLLNNSRTDNKSEDNHHQMKNLDRTDKSVETPKFTNP